MRAFREPSRKAAGALPEHARYNFLLQAAQVCCEDAPDLAALLGRTALKYADSTPLKLPKGHDFCRHCGIVFSSKTCSRLQVTDGARRGGTSKRKRDADDPQGQAAVVFVCKACGHLSRLPRTAWHSALSLAARSAATLKVTCYITLTLPAAYDKACYLAATNTFLVLGPPPAPPSLPMENKTTAVEGSSGQARGSDHSLVRSIAMEGGRDEAPGGHSTVRTTAVEGGNDRAGGDHNIAGKTALEGSLDEAGGDHSTVSTTALEGGNDPAAGDILVRTTAMEGSHDHAGAIYSTVGTTAVEGSHDHARGNYSTVGTTAVEGSHDQAANHTIVSIPAGPTCLQQTGPSGKRSPDDKQLVSATTSPNPSSVTGDFVHPAATDFTRNLVCTQLTTATDTPTGQSQHDIAVDEHSHHNTSPQAATTFAESVKPLDCVAVGADVLGPLGMGSVLPGTSTNGARSSLILEPAPATALPSTGAVSAELSLSLSAAVTTAVTVAGPSVGSEQVAECVDVAAVTSPEQGAEHGHVAGRKGAEQVTDGALVAAVIGLEQVAGRVHLAGITGSEQGADSADVAGIARFEQGAEGVDVAGITGSEQGADGVDMAAVTGPELGAEHGHLAGRMDPAQVAEGIDVAAITSPGHTAGSVDVVTSTGPAQVAEGVHVGTATGCEQVVEGEHAGAASSHDRDAEGAQRQKITPAATETACVSDETTVANAGVKNLEMYEAAGVPGQDNQAAATERVTGALGIDDRTAVDASKDVKAHVGAGVLGQDITHVTETPDTGGKTAADAGMDASTHADTGVHGQDVTHVTETPGASDKSVVDAVMDVKAHVGAGVLGQGMTHVTAASDMGDNAAGDAGMDLNTHADAGVHAQDVTRVGETLDASDKVTVDAVMDVTTHVDAGVPDGEDITYVTGTPDASDKTAVDAGMDVKLHADTGVHVQDVTHVTETPDASDKAIVDAGMDVKLHSDAGVHGQDVTHVTETPDASDKAAVDAGMDLKTHVDAGVDATVVATEHVVGAAGVSKKTADTVTVAAMDVDTGVHTGGVPAEVDPESNVHSGSHGDGSDSTATGCLSSLPGLAGMGTAHAFIKDKNLPHAAHQRDNVAGQEHDDVAVMDLSSPMDHAQKVAGKDAHVTEFDMSAKAPPRDVCAMPQPHDITKISQPHSIPQHPQQQDICDRPQPHDIFGNPQPPEMSENAQPHDISAKTQPHNTSENQQSHDISENHDMPVQSGIIVTDRLQANADPKIASVCQVAKSLSCDTPKQPDTSIPCALQSNPHTAITDNCQAANPQLNHIPAQPDTASIQGLQSNADTAVPDGQQIAQLGDINAAPDSTTTDAVKSNADTAVPDGHRTAQLGDINAAPDSNTTGAVMSKADTATDACTSNADTAIAHISSNPGPTTAAATPESVESMKLVDGIPGLTEELHLDHLPEAGTPNTVAMIQTAAARVASAGAGTEVAACCTGPTEMQEASCVTQPLQSSDTPAMQEASCVIPPLQSSDAPAMQETRDLQSCQVQPADIVPNQDSSVTTFEARPKKKQKKSKQVNRKDASSPASMLEADCTPGTAQGANQLDVTQLDVEQGAAGAAVGMPAGLTLPAAAGSMSLATCQPIAPGVKTANHETLHPDKTSSPRPPASAIVKQLLGLDDAVQSEVSHSKKAAKKKAKKQGGTSEEALQRESVSETTKLVPMQLLAAGKATTQPPMQQESTAETTKKVDPPRSHTTNQQDSARQASEQQGSARKSSEQQDAQLSVRASQLGTGPSGGLKRSRSKVLVEEKHQPEAGSEEQAIRKKSKRDQERNVLELGKVMKAKEQQQEAGSEEQGIRKESKRDQKRNSLELSKVVKAKEQQDVVAEDLQAPLDAATCVPCSTPAVITSMPGRVEREIDVTSTSISSPSGPSTKDRLEAVMNEPDCAGHGHSQQEVESTTEDEQRRKGRKRQRNGTGADLSQPVLMQVTISGTAEMAAPREQQKKRVRFSDAVVLQQAGTSSKSGHREAIQLPIQSQLNPPPVEVDNSKSVAKKSKPQKKQSVAASQTYTSPAHATQRQGGSEAGTQLFVADTAPVTLQRKASGYGWEPDATALKKLCSSLPEKLADVTARLASGAQQAPGLRPGWRFKGVASAQNKQLASWSRMVAAHVQPINPTAAAHVTNVEPVSSAVWDSLHVVRENRKG